MPFDAQIAVAHLDAKGLEPDRRCVSDPPHSEKHPLAFHHWARIQMEAGPVSDGFGTDRPGAQPHVDPIGIQDLGQSPGDGGFLGPKQPGTPLHQGHLRPETGVDLGQLTAHRATAENGHRPGRVRRGKGLVTGPGGNSVETLDRRPHR